MELALARPGGPPDVAAVAAPQLAHCVGVACAAEPPFKLEPLAVAAAGGAIIAAAESSMFNLLSPTVDELRQLAVAASAPLLPQQLRKPERERSRHPHPAHPGSDPAAGWAFNAGFFAAGCGAGVAAAVA